MFHAMNLRAAMRAFTVALFALSLSWTGARAADPIKIGFSMALTGGVAPNGKQLLAALELWRDDVNQKGGLLGRPVAARLLRRPEQPGERAGHLHQAHHASTKSISPSVPTPPT